MGAGEAFVAGGTESMSRVPMMGFNLLPHPSWTEQQVLDFVNVGLTAERVADQYGLTRADQEAFAFARDDFDRGRDRSADRDDRARRHEAGARGGDFARASPRDLRPDRAYARHWKALAQLRKP
jgi:hypothetical protein